MERNNNSRVIAIKIMKLIVGVDELREMTVTGKNNKKSIPKDIFEAVFGKFF